VPFLVVRDGFQAKFMHVVANLVMLGVKSNTLISMSFQFLHVAMDIHVGRANLFLFYASLDRSDLCNCILQ